MNILVKIVLNQPYLLVVFVIVTALSIFIYKRLEAEVGTWALSCAVAFCTALWISVKGAGLLLGVVPFALCALLAANSMFFYNRSKKVFKKGWKAATFKQYSTYMEMRMGFLVEAIISFALTGAVAFFCVAFLVVV